MEVRDYNGPDEWSAPAIIERYERYCRRVGQAIRKLVPNEHVNGDVRWVYPIMEAVIVGIKSGDLACVELGVEFVESGHKQAFGRILHANAARALRRVAALLSADQIARLRFRILAMLVAGQVPHEYHEYAKLFRRIGLGASWPDARARVDASNPYVMRYVKYLDGCAKAEGAGEHGAAPDEAQ
jgi:hypothetical protein